jgi:hypothetical protein
MYFKKMLENQRKAMEDYKWFKGQELGRDPGEAACREWVEKYAATYRKEYDGLFNEMIDHVIKQTNDKINKILEETGVSLPPEIKKKMAKVLIEQFCVEWMIEKVTEPMNKHVDEI